MPMGTSERLNIESKIGDYDGYDINATAGSRTAQNFDLLHGMCLQENDYDNDSRLTSNPTPTGRAGTIFSVPTLGQQGKYAIVYEPPGRDVNVLSSSVSNLRLGGTVKLATKADGVQALIALPNGATITRGVTRFFPGTDAKLYRHYVTGRNGRIAVSTAASTAISNTASETTFDNASVTIPANSLQAGDIIRGRFQVIATATNSTDTLLVKVKLGSNILASSPTVDVSNNDIVWVDLELVVRSIGASGAVISAAMAFNGTPAAAASAADIPAASNLASTTVDTTGDLTLSLTATWSVASSSNSCRCDIANWTAVPTLPTVAVAQETATGTSVTATSGRLTRVRFNGDGLL